MQAIILAGGNSSRFVPFNRKHKSLFPLFGKSIIEHTLEAISRTPIKEIIIVCKDPTEFQAIIENSPVKTNLDIQYCVQSEALGMGDALLKTKDKISSDFFVLSAHRVDFDMYYSSMVQKLQNEVSAVLVAKQTDDVSQYGSATMEDDRVTSVIEKPEEADRKKGFRLLSTYLLTKKFLDVLENTSLEHYQFEKALSTFCKSSTVKAIEISNETFSLKYAWNLLDVKDVLLEKQSKKHGSNVSIADSAIVSDEVTLGNNVKIMENVVIKGPCYIGDNSVIGDFVMLRDGVVVENDCVIGSGSEIKNCIISENTKIHDGIVEDSVIAEGCRLGAKFCTSNVRLDRNPVTVHVIDKKVNSGKKSLGVFMGKNVKTGIQCSTMPGIIIGNDSLIGPSTVVMENINDGHLIYAKQEYVIVDKKNS